MNLFIYTASDIDETFLADWKNLLKSSLWTDPFLTPTWLSPCVSLYPGRYKLLVGYCNGTLVFLMPIETPCYGSIPICCIRLGGHISSEQQRMGIVRSGEELEIIVHALVSMFSNKNAARPVIGLDCLVGEDPLAIMLIKSICSRGWKKVEHPGKESPYVKLESDFETYLKGVKRNVRREYLRRKRKIEHDLSVERMIISSGEEVSYWLPEIIRVEHNSWKKDTGLFCPKFRELSSRRLFAMAESGMLRVFLLLSDKQLIAYDIEFMFEGRLWSFSVSFDAEYRKYGPGIDLQVEVIRYGFDQHIKAVELLGGSQSYKSAWAHATRERSSIYLFPCGIKSAVGPIFLNAFKSIRRNFG
ncbi:MAG TPA: hypothetical protein DDW42_03905 [Desulfobacteraceae bacterium]|nr:hypothetical protein [Desulfobacteraceae bacterium]